MHLSSGRKMVAHAHYLQVRLAAIMLLSIVLVASLQPSSPVRSSKMHLSMLGEGSATSSNSPVLVASMDSQSQAFLQYFATNRKVQVQTTDVENAASTGNAIAVIDANSITAANAALLQQMNAVYILPGGVASASLLTSKARNSCKYDLYVSNADQGDDAASNAAKRLDNLLQRLRSPAPTAEDTLLDAGEWSHFVSLTFPSIDQALPFLPALRIGTDAWELRVDLLDDFSSESLHRQIALLRDACPLPIVFTVRSVGQIGKFPPEPERIFALLREGLRAGCEWIDVEACWPLDLMDAFTSSAVERYPLTSRLLGSYHVTTAQTRAQIDEIFAKCDLNGRAHVLKAVTGATNDADCQLIHASGAASPTGKPYIGLCLGGDGVRSRVLNRRFTPVTHKLMATAAPGQLTVEELMERRLQEGLCTSKEYYLFGTPIKQSLSPSMHNGAFRALLMPHSYALNEQENVAEYVAAMSAPTFGGASVTIPHKETIIPLIDEVRGAAASIGAVNTVVIENGRKIGYNTDWLGIKRPVLRQLRRRGVPWANDEVQGQGATNGNGSGKGRSIGLVIGAGGTAKAACYAIRDLGMDLIICNPRSQEIGDTVAAAFGGRCISVEELLSPNSFDPATVHVVMSTIPAEAEFTLPPVYLQVPNLPVILDVVYKPARTKLIEQAMEHGCLFVQGATMLLEQGMEQFELWHRRRAPRVVMDAAVFSGAERLSGN